jgi:hypothetical protein
MDRMTRERGVSFKEAAAEIMEEAYHKVSGGGTLPANARQLMYAARGHIQEKTGRQLDSNYFTQTLLPDYMEENDALDWDVAYDARGHFTEPHDNGENSFGIGTLEVRDYLAAMSDPSVTDASISQAKVETSGPSGNFGAVLFIEKEGFAPLFKKAQIAEKYDIAIMSTKGMSVVAARLLVDEMCSDHDIPLLLLHDFDKAGFLIAGTLQRDTRRYEFQNSIEVVDLGLSLADVEAMGLQSEYQHHPKARKSALIANLHENGASEEEIAFMFRDFDRLRSTRRVDERDDEPAVRCVHRAQAKGERHREDRPPPRPSGRGVHRHGKRPTPGRGSGRAVGQNWHAGLQATEEVGTARPRDSEKVALYEMGRRG